jgi:hypothetical protein
MKERPLPWRWLPVAVNHRGKGVGVWLGIVFTAVLVISAVAISTVAWIGAGRLRTEQARLLWIVTGCVAVTAAGLYDDLRPARTRGLLRHIGMLLRGTITSGIVKLAVIVLASGFVVWMLGGRGVRLVLGVPVVAGSANLWNMLDVVPGRAMKYFLPAAAVVGSAAAAGGRGEYALLAAAAVWAGLPALVIDLREWAMLGDSGANALGFVIGVELFGTVSTLGLAVALVLILALHALSETVTLSRVIRGVPPLRWFDELGRTGDPRTGTESPRQETSSEA